MSGAGGSRGRDSERVDLEELRHVAQQHGACYEVWPAQTVVAGRRVRAGFDLELLGIGEAHSAVQTPGGPRCEETYRDLRRIANWLLSSLDGSARVEIAPFEAIWHETPSRQLRPEVALEIHIAPAGGLAAPVDEGVRSSLAALEHGLAQLGIARGR